MNFSSIAVALMGDDDDQKKEARTKLSAMTESEKKAWKAWKKAAFDDEPAEGEGREGAGDGEKPKDGETEETTTTTPAAAAASEGGGESSDDEKKEAAAVAATAKLARIVAEQGRELDELRKKRETEEREAVLATRKDLPDKLVAYLRTLPTAQIQKIVAEIPPPAADPAAATRVTATHGAGRHDESSGEAFGAMRASRLPPEESADLRTRMGRPAESPGVRWHKDQKNALEFPSMAPDEARRILAARAKAGIDGPAKRPGTEIGR